MSRVAARCWCCSIRKGKAADPGLPLLTQFLTDWGINAGDDIVLDASGMGQLIGTNDASVPVVPPPYPAHAITRSFQPADGVSAGAIDDQPRRRIERPHRAADREHEPAAAGPRPICRRSSAGRWRSNADKGDKQGPIYARRRRVRAGHRRADRLRLGQQPAPRRRIRSPSPNRAWSPSATPTSSPTSRSASRAIVTSS